MERAFDTDALIDRVDGDTEFLAETIAMLDEDSPALLAQIREAAVARDAAKLTTAAHALKGMLANFCAEPAETAARELETMGREDQWAEVEAAVADAQQETERLRNELHQYLRANVE